MIKWTALVLSAAALLGISSIVMAMASDGCIQKGRCRLCSDLRNASVSTDNSSTGIGILNFNNFSINTLRICDESPNRSSGYDSNINTYGETGSTVLINSNLDRRIAEITIAIRKGSKPSQKKMQGFLCADCCKKIRQENVFDIAFINCLTKEIFPIDKNTIEFYIGDYAIHRLSNAKEELRYLIFFAPEQ